MTDPSIPPRDEKLIRKRQASGARATALLLAGFVLLVFFVTIAKITVNQ